MGEVLFQKTCLDSWRIHSPVKEARGATCTLHLFSSMSRFFWIFTGSLLGDRHGEEKRIQCSELGKMSISPALDAVGVLPRFSLPGRGMASPLLWRVCVGC